MQPKKLRRKLIDSHIRLTKDTLKVFSEENTENEKQ